MGTTTLTEPVRLADCDGPFTAGRLEDCRQPATSPTGARRVFVVVFVSVSSRRMGVGWDYGRATRKRTDGTAEAASILASSSASFPTPPLLLLSRNPRSE